MNTPTRGRLLAVAIGCTAFWTTVAGLAAHAPMKSTALGPHENRLLTQLVIPQGWNFFTRDPREDDIFVYRRHEGELHDALAWPNAGWANGLGLRRTGRAQGIEVGHIIAGIDWDEIAPCRDGEPACIAATPLEHTAVNPVPSPMLCGELAIVMRPPMPWAWADHAAPEHAPIKTTRIDVRCP